MSRTEAGGGGVALPGSSGAGGECKGVSDGVSKGSRGGAVREGQQESGEQRRRDWERGGNRVEEERDREGAKAAKMINGERDQGYVVLGKGADCGFNRVAVRGATDEFGANACKMRRKNIREGRVGLPSKVARDSGDGDINTNGVYVGGGGGREINGDVQRATPGWSVKRC
jgi:hypothetical protein